jgi:hypothetical protein
MIALVDIEGRRARPDWDRQLVAALDSARTLTRAALRIELFRIRPARRTLGRLSRRFLGAVGVQIVSFSAAIVGIYFRILCRPARACILE